MKVASQNYGKFKKYYLDVRRFANKPAAKTSITTILSLFLVAFFLAFALRPTLVKIAELRVEITDSEEVLIKLETKAKTLETVAILWQKYSPELKYIQASIPVSPKYNLFLKEMEALAIRNGLIYSSAGVDGALIASQLLDPYAASTKLEPVSLHFSARMGGGYVELLGFLEDVRSVDRLIEIEGINFSSELASEGAEEEGIEISVDGNVYYFADFSLLSSKLNKK